MSRELELLVNLVVVVGGFVVGYLCGEHWPAIERAIWRAWRWLLRV
jgi:membrane-associated phospholipid phosphatase